MLKALRTEVPFFNRALTAAAMPFRSSYELPASKTQVIISASSVPRSMANTSTPLLRTCFLYKGNCRLNSLASLIGGAIVLFSMGGSSFGLSTVIVKCVAVVGIEQLAAGSQNFVGSHRLVSSQFGIHHVGIAQQLINGQAIGAVH